MSELIQNPYVMGEDKADPLIPTATRQIYDYIREEYGEPDDEEGDTNVNRASAAYQCTKRRWFKRKGYKGIAITPRKIVNFTLGDLSELTVQYFIKKACVGPGKMYSEVDFGEKTGEQMINGKLIEFYKQKDLHLTLHHDSLPPIEIVCHADGLGKRNLDGQWELIECKSSANWGYKGFMAGEPNDYLPQAHTVMMTDECRALGVRATRYFYLKKETGNLWDRLEFFNDLIWQKTKNSFFEVMSEEMPPTPYDLTTHYAYVLKPGNVRKTKVVTKDLEAQFPCTYCPYIEHCFGKFELEFTEDQWGHQKPAYVFRSAS